MAAESPAVWNYVSVEFHSHHLSYCVLSMVEFLMDVSLKDVNSLHNNQQALTCEYGSDIL